MALVSRRHALWLVVLVACNEHDDTAAPSSSWRPSLAYTVDVRRAETGAVDIELVYRRPASGNLRIVQGGTPGNVWVEDVSATVDGQEVHAEEMIGQKSQAYELRVREGVQEVVFRYRARPRGIARHGHQGVVSPRLTLLAGHVFWVPATLTAAERDTGGSSPVDVRVKVVAPEGLDVVSSMLGSADALDPALGGRWALTHLGMSNTAIGELVSAVRPFGPVELRVHVPKAWPTSRRLETVERAARLFGTFRRYFPCDELTAYTVIFVPPMEDEDEPRLTGESWATTIALAPDGYTEARRSWELMAHRLAHTFNKYEVCGGIRIPRASDHWFLEGWAVWSEITMLQQAHVIETDDELDQLGDLYVRVALGLDRGTRDRPIREEAFDIRPSEVEYLHYRKSALVMLELDRELRRVTDGQKSMNAFMAAVWPEHRAGQRSLDLWGSLRRYAQHDFSALKERIVDSRGFFYPLSESFVARLASTEPSPIAIAVGESVMSEAQRAELTTYLGDTGLVPAATVPQVLDAMVRVHTEYLRRDATFLPPEIREHMAQLPASFRYLAFLHEKSELFEDPAAYDAFMADAPSAQ